MSERRGDSPKTRKPRIDWSAVRGRLHGRLNKEDQQVLDALAAGKSTPEIARVLGSHRSAIWRCVERIKAKLRELESE